MAVTNEDWLQAQHSVLGSALIEQDLVAKVISETTADDYSGTCRTVYAAMRRLFLSGVPVDPVSVAAALGKEYTSYIAQLMEITPTAANIDQYIRLCREQARIISIRALGDKIATAEGIEDLRSLLDKANGLVVDRPTLRITTMYDALQSFMARHDEKPQYLTWPVRELNDRIYTELGDFVIFAGYPSAGKSAWALQCAWHWAQKYKVGFFSLETSPEKLFDRQMSAVAGLSMDDIKRNTISDNGWATLANMTTDITNRQLELIPAAGMTPTDIRAHTMMRGYQIILVDYLQLVQSVGVNRTEKVTNISLALHTMAQSMGVLVVALSQLKRREQGASPDMSDLRESGQIEQDADMVMILSLEKKGSTEGNRVMKIAKNKEGTCPSILLAFDGKHQTFTKAQRSGDALKTLAAAPRKRSGYSSGDMDQLPMTIPVPAEWEQGE